MNKHTKGYRGHRKAECFLQSKGFVTTIWPHSRFQTDCFGFADLIGSNIINGQSIYVQVKNTEKKPSDNLVKKIFDECLRTAYNKGLRNVLVAIVWYYAYTRQPIWKVEVVDNRFSQAVH